LTALVISERALNAFLTAGVKLHDDIHILSLKILNSVTGKQRATYNVLWQLALVNVLDLSGATVQFFPGGRVIQEVQAWSFRAGFSSGADLLQCETRDWIASQRMVDVVQASSLTGFKCALANQVATPGCS
jgi:hypothetical protein